MMRFGMLVVGAMALGLAACGGQQTAEENTGLTSQEQRLNPPAVQQVCGHTCPSGYYAFQYLCKSSCSDSCFSGTNATECVEIRPTDQQFNACGTTCPEGFSVTSSAYSPQCVKTYPSSGTPNSVTCVRQ